MQSHQLGLIWIVDNIYFLDVHTQDFSCKTSVRTQSAAISRVALFLLIWPDFDVQDKMLNHKSAE